MKLRKLPEPALSREFTGEVFRRKALFCLPERPGVSTVASHAASQSQGPSEAAAALAQLWGKEFSLCPHVAPSVRWAPLHTRWDCSTLSLMDQECCSQSHRSTCRLIYFLIRYLCGPFKKEKTKHLRCARHCVRHFYICPL